MCERHGITQWEPFLLPFQDPLPQPSCCTSPPVPKQDPGPIGLYLEAVSFGQWVPTVLSMADMPWLKTKTAWDSEGFWPSAGTQASYRGCRVGVGSTFPLLPPLWVSCGHHHHTSHLNVPKHIPLSLKVLEVKVHDHGNHIYYDWQL